MSSVPVLIVGGSVLLVVVSFGLLHHAMGRSHDSLRRELRRHRVLLELRDVRVAIAGRAMLSASETWSAGDLLVTDRAVVFFPVTRGLSMKLTPFVIVKKGDEEAIEKRWGMHRLVASSGPGRSRSRMGKPRVSLETKGAMRSRWTLHVETLELEALLAALGEFLGAEPGAASKETAPT